MRPPFPAMQLIKPWFDSEREAPVSPELNLEVRERVDAAISLFEVFSSSQRSKGVVERTFLDS